MALTIVLTLIDYKFFQVSDVILQQRFWLLDSDFLFRVEVIVAVIVFYCEFFKVAAFSKEEENLMVELESDIWFCIYYQRLCMLILLINLLRTFFNEFRVKELLIVIIVPLYCDWFARECNIHVLSKLPCTGMPFVDQPVKFITKECFEGTVLLKELCQSFLMILKIIPEWGFVSELFPKKVLLTDRE